jgi:hypothetical protein
MDIREVGWGGGHGLDQSGSGQGQGSIKCGDLCD